MEKPLSSADDHNSEPLPAALTAAHIVYGLHAFAIRPGIVRGIHRDRRFCRECALDHCRHYQLCEALGCTRQLGGITLSLANRTFWFALMWLLDKQPMYV